MSTSGNYPLHAAGMVESTQVLNVETAQSTQVWARMAKHYAIVAAGCLVFAVMYAQFSHEVFSPFMTWMFAIPLLAGALPAGIAQLVGAPVPAHTTRQLWALAIATFTIASCLRGIFEIAGTGSAWLWVYVVLGLVFVLVAGFSAFLRGRRPYQR